MNAHRAVPRQEIAQRSPDVIALMVASEFSRAASRSVHRENVIRCYARAQELLGVLETLPLSEEAAACLSALYRQCASRFLLSDSQLAPETVSHLGMHLAEAFQRAAEQLAEIKSHA